MLPGQRVPRRMSHCSSTLKDAHVFSNVYHPLYFFLNIIIYFCCSLDTFLWSEIHIAEWYLNMYSKQLALNAESSASSASSASTPNRRTKRNALTDAIAEAGLLYAQKCDDWYQNEQRDVPPAQGLSPCPCTMQQAGVDDRFTTDTACHRGYIGSRFCAFYHNGATECIRSTSAG